MAQALCQSALRVCELARAPKIDIFPLALLSQRIPAQQQYPASLQHINCSGTPRVDISETQRIAGELTRHNFSLQDLNATE
jgi:hypothetical protein